MRRKKGLLGPVVGSDGDCEKSILSVAHHRYLPSASSPNRLSSG